MAIALDVVLQDPPIARDHAHALRADHEQERSGHDRLQEHGAAAVDQGRKIRGGKTGTTEAAGHCMLIGAKVSGHDVIMAFLGGDTNDSRFVDYARAVRWLEQARGIDNAGPKPGVISSSRERLVARALARACARAAVAIDEVAVVARLASLDVAVAAHRHFDRARRRAAVVCDGISVIAFLAAILHAIAADSRAATAAAAAAAFVDVAVLIIVVVAVVMSPQ